MPTLEAYVKKAIDLLGSEQLLGRYVSLSSLTTTTAVSNTQLAFGGNSEQRYAQWWMWRISTTTTADKIRQADSFTPSSGTLTHSGTNYSDTTATDEVLVLLPPALDPYKVRTACDSAIKQCTVLDKTIIPARRLNSGRYRLSDLSWLNASSKIKEICYRNSPILSRNRSMDKWFTMGTGGSVTPPDFWTLAGASATVTRGTSNLYDGPYVATLTRAGTDCTLTQNVGILPTGVSGDSLRGRTVTAVLRVRASVASRVRVRIYENGSATASSDYHTGGSTYEVLTCSATVASTSDTLTFGVSLESGDTAVNIAECWLQDGSSVSDTDYRDDNWSHPIPSTAYSFEQSGSLVVELPNVGFPAQFRISSERPYPGLDATRLGTGAADADESDAPLFPVAKGIIAFVYRAIYGEGSKEADEAWREFDNAKLAYATTETDEPGGKTFVRPPFAAAAARVR